MVCLRPLPGLDLTVAENGVPHLAALPLSTRQVKVAPASDVKVTLTLAFNFLVVVFFLPGAFVIVTEGAVVSSARAGALVVKTWSPPRL